MEKNIQQWAFDLQKEVYQKWKSDYPNWKPGFKVFYGPIRKNPGLMIISHNPGGSEKDFIVEDKIRFDGGDFTPPKEVPYSTYHRMSREMQRIFAGHEDILASSVTFPIIFFRSRNVAELNAQERLERYEMERFCLLKTKEIIEVLEPKKILVIGFKTADLLERIIGIFDDEEFLSLKKGSRLLVRKSKKGNLHILSVMHITGARMNGAEKEFIQKEVQQFID